MVTIWYFPTISKIQRQIYSNISINIMPCTPRHHRRRLPHLFRHSLWMAHLKSHSQLDIAKKRSTLPTSWKSTLNSLRRISTVATQFSGGWADEDNFRASFSWRVTFYVFLVSILVNLIHTTQIWIVSQVLLSPLKGSSLEGGTQSLLDVPVFKLIQFEFSCLSRSAFILNNVRAALSITTPSPATPGYQRSLWTLLPPPLPTLQVVACHLGHLRVAHSWMYSTYVFE